MKKKIVGYGKVVLLILLVVIFAKVAWQSYLLTAFPFGVKELRGLEYLAIDPQPKECADCGERFLYRDKDHPTDCTLANIFFPQGATNGVAKEGDYTIMLQSVEERLSWKGTKAYAFELNAYRLFEQHCRPDDSRDSVVDIPGSLGTG